MRHIPDTELAIETKYALFPQSIEQEERNATRQSGSYKFPWPANVGFKTTPARLPKGWHGTWPTTDQALDFIREPFGNSNILAAATGSVTKLCKNTSGQQAWLGVTASGTTEEMIYMHLKQNTMPGSIQLGTTINQGDFLGQLVEGAITENSPCYMRSTGTHLHWGLPVKPITIEDYTFTTDGSGNLRMVKDGVTVSTSTILYSTQGQQSPTPTISSVSPNPMPPSPSGDRQPITIYGSNFVAGATLTFRITDSPTYTYPGRVPDSLSSTQIVYNINVGGDTHNWTAQVINPGGQASNEFPFRVEPVTTSGDLVAYYPFTGNANDVSGHNHHGSVNGATLTTDRFNNANSAYSFDGNDTISVADAPDLVMSNALTMAAWIYPTGVSSNNVGIVMNKEGEYEFAVFVDQTIRWAFGNTNPGWVWTSTGYSIPFNAWSHVAITYASGVITTFVNGQQVQQYTGSGTIGDAHPDEDLFTIGMRQLTEWDQWFRGRIDEVRLYNKVLSTAEITELMQSPNMNIKHGTTNVPNDIGSYAFSPTVVGGSQAVTFTIENLGDGTLNLSGISVTGTNPGDFTPGTLPTSIAAGNTGSFDITFVPTGSGLSSATVSISSNDENKTPYTFSISGTGEAVPENSFLLWTR